MTNTTNPNETNGLLDGHAFHTAVDYTRQLSLAEVSDAKGHISRVRILAEGPRCDISYIIATLPDGSMHPVRVNGNTSGYLRDLKRDFITWAKEERVFAKGLGLLDENNWSILR